jgi:hypothetical protein
MKSSPLIRLSTLALALAALGPTCQAGSSEASDKGTAAPPAGATSAAGKDTASKPSVTGGDLISAWSEKTSTTAATAKMDSIRAVLTVALVHLAMYDAVNAIVGGHKPYASSPTAKPGASPESAVIRAAYVVLGQEFPGQATQLKAYDAALAWFTAMADALVATWDGKYHYNFWRPVTAIPAGETDGNKKTEPDAAWEPLLVTPPHPEYPCAHCEVTAATMTAVTTAFGKPDLEFVIQNPKTKEVRRYPKVDAAIEEVSNARVWGGIHYRTSAMRGGAAGNQIGEHIAEHFFGLAAATVPSVDK